MQHYKDLMRQEAALLLERLRNAKDNPKSVYGLKMGIKKLDDAMGGSHAGELVVLAARPSIGKSSLGFQIHRGVAEALTEPKDLVLFFSVEMMTQSVLLRMASQHAKVSAAALNRGQVGAKELARFEASLEHVLALPLIIVGAPTVTVNTVEKKIKECQQVGYRVRQIGVDYLQRMADIDTSSTQATIMSIGKITSRMKQIALRDECAVWLLAQVNRATEGNEAKTPTLANLRDSGRIEEDADRVLFINRPDFYKQANDPSLGLRPQQAVISIAKAREDAVGPVVVTFNPAFTTFEG